MTTVTVIMGFPGGTGGKEPACQCRRPKRRRFDPWVRKIPWRREWLHTPVLPGESHGQRSLATVREVRRSTQLGDQTATVIIIKLTFTEFFLGTRRYSITLRYQLAKSSGKNVLWGSFLIVLYKWKTEAERNLKNFSRITWVATSGARMQTHVPSASCYLYPRSWRAASACQEAWFNCVET